MRHVELLHQELTSRNFTVSSIHEGLDKKSFAAALLQFRSGSSRVLISTDVLARGIPGIIAQQERVSLVINYDLPKLCEGYIRR
jgi:translation initiation factor 4A